MTDYCIFSGIGLVVSESDRSASSHSEQSSTQDPIYTQQIIGM